LESIADACYNLARTVNRRRQSGIRLIKEQDEQLAHMMGLCEKAITQMQFTMHGHRRQHNIDETYHLENSINQMRNRLKADNIRAVNEHEHDYATGAIFSDMVGEMEKLGDYVVNVVEARLGKNALSAS
jgi:phosphate:Na+ symporter